MRKRGRGLGLAGLALMAIGCGSATTTQSTTPTTTSPQTLKQIAQKFDDGVTPLLDGRKASLLKSLGRYKTKMKQYDKETAGIYQKAQEYLDERKKLKQDYQDQITKIKQELDSFIK